MRRKLDLRRATSAIVKDLKATMHVPLPPYNFTVIQTLCEHYRADAYNDVAADALPSIRKEFGNGIRDFATVRGTSTRKAQKIADNTWKWDHAADRRIRKGSAAPYRGRPEVYDSEVVWAFADAIARITGRSRFATGHHGDRTITEKEGKGGPMFRVLIASIQWAMTGAWQSTARPGTKPPQVKPEGLLTLLKRDRLTNPTD
jgi:hypothetical protein